MKNNKGFTLIELLVVIVMLVGISLVAVPNIAQSLNSRKGKNIEDDQKTILEYIERYRLSDTSFNNCLKEYNYVNLQNFATRENIKLKSDSSSISGTAILVDGELVLANNDNYYEPTEHQECQ